MKTSITFLKSKMNNEDTVKAISETDTDYIHVDIMDGKFVPRVQLPISETIRLFAKSTKKLDVHLMVEHPREYITALANLNVSYISIHIEIEDNIEELIELIHSYGIGAGLAINSETEVSALNKYLDRIDYVLIMGIIPGAGGQKMIPETVDKIRVLKYLRDNYNYHYQISFDGGVNETTRPLLDDLDIIVSGSYVCMSDDYQSKIDSLR